MVVVGLALPLLAQTPDTASIRGQVTDSTQGAVAGAQVTVTDRQTGVERDSQTNGVGNFFISGLPAAGTYDLSVRKEGFAPLRQANIRLSGGATAAVDLQLGVSGGETKVEVTGTLDTVSTHDTQVGEVLSPLEIEATPLPNRRLTYLPLLNAANRPAINQGDVFMNQDLFTTNGAGRRQTWFEVDGNNAIDSWGRQTIFTNLQVDDVSEMDVISNSVSAEYGGTAGSVINIITKSGTNHYHGDLIGVWRPSDTSASLSAFNPTTANGNFIASDSLGETGADFGGPIGRNHRNYFFASSEHSWENRGSPVTSPLEPGVFVGKYRDWMAFFKIDRQINDSNRIFFRSNLDVFHDTNPNGTVGGSSLPTVDRLFKRRTYAEQVGETAIFSPTLLNNLRLQFQLASPITQFDPVINGTQFVVPIAGAATFTTGTSQSALLQNRQYEIGDALSAALGRHTINFGGDVIHAHSGGNSEEFGGPIYLGQFKYLTCSLPVATCEGAAYLDDINNVASYTQSFGNSNYTVDDTLWSVFAQDYFQMRRNLTLSLGLRYEHQTFTDSNLSFSPRVGFSYNVHNDHKTVVRAAFGIFYSQVVDNSEANYALTGPTGVFNYTATPGQIGFPASIANAPLPAFPQGAQVPLRTLYVRPGRRVYYNQFFPVSTLIGYQSGLWNPYTEQWTFGVEREVASNWVLSSDYVGSHTLKINRPLDVDPPASFIRTTQGQIRSAQAANCTRPLWIFFYSQQNLSCDPNGATNPQPAYSVIQSDVNDGSAFYDALDINLRHRFGGHAEMLLSYVYSHAIDNVDPDVPGQNPNDARNPVAPELGNAIYDQRHRLVLSGVYVAPLDIHVGGVATLASGLPYNIVTGTTNSGDTGATTDRPVVNGRVIPRNAGRGAAIYDLSPFVERAFGLGTERIRLSLRAEAFNVFNHANFVGYNGTYGNGPTAPLTFGQPLQGITNQLPARFLQFQARLAF